MKDKNKKICKACGKEIDKDARECPHCGKVQVAFFDKHRTITVVIILVIILSIVSIVVPISETTNSSNNTTPATSSDTKESTSTADLKESASTSDKQSDKEASKKEVSSNEEKDSKTITAHKLAAAYNNDQENADKLYKDKEETIKGRIEDKGVTSGQHYVILDSDDPFSAVKVECLFNSQSEIDKITNLTKGEEVVVQGKVSGQSENINVEVKDCVLK